VTGSPAPAFSWPARVYWEDTDGGGVVYYANYLKFLERARTEWLRALGFSQTDLLKDPGIVFVVSNLSIEYCRPARLDDSLDISCNVEIDGRVCLRFAQHIRRAMRCSSRPPCASPASMPSRFVRSAFQPASPMRSVNKEPLRHES
jgi:acyl-CoA thioester hydrolase